jgi:serine/threonine protein kinase
MRQTERDTAPSEAPRGSVEIQPDLYRGQRIGKYEVVSLLTMGGMAELFLAFTAGPGGFRKYVVVKRILPDIRSDEQFVKMFLDEARVTAAFSHPNIAQVFDLGEEEDGLYLAMEFIAGQNLNQITGACWKRKVMLAAGFACMVARDVCLALQYAHTFADPAGKPFPVIHRDVAQKNVMITYDGVTKLLDFGIAKARGSLGRTNIGMVKGTTGYMSPEQVHGEPLDGRSDVFSVGVMLHEMLLRKRLFAGQTEMEEMQKILNAPIPVPHQVVSDLPEEISQVVMRALARNREDRWATARDMAKALERACGKLMFEREQASAFMKELFGDRLKATQALLESAGGKWDQAQISAALRVLTADAGASFPDPRPSLSSAKGPPESVKPRVERTITGDEERAVLQARLEAAAMPSPTPPASGPYVLVLVLMFAVVLAVIAIYSVFFSGPSPVVQGEPSLRSSSPLGPVPLNSGLKPYDDKKAEPEALPPLPAKEPTARPDAGIAHTPPVKTGKLTLVTLPEAKVLIGSKSYGRTPLFNAAVPVGTHLIRLQGPDGRTHLFSVQISTDKPSRFRFSLADLPTER